MLDYLLDVESRLPTLLKSMDGWIPRSVTLEKPHIERLFREDGPNRIYLHRILRCNPEEVFLHSHPWPLAVRVIDGFYKMQVGVVGKTASTVILGSGSLYEMIDVGSEHAICPLTETTLSLMVSGVKYADTMVKSKRNPDLDLVRAEKLLNDFKAYYR